MHDNLLALNSMLGDFSQLKLLKFKPFSPVANLIFNRIVGTPIESMPLEVILIFFIMNNFVGSTMNFH
jgi:hypothetical protein